MAGTIKLKAEARARWGGKQFIARITGRDPQFQLARKFCGRKAGKHGEYSFFETDEPGLYVTRDIGSGGSNTDTYHAVTRGDDGGLEGGTVSFEDALRIARRMDEAASWDEIAVEEGWVDAPASESSPVVPGPDYQALLASVPTEALVAALAARGITVP